MYFDRARFKGDIIAEFGIPEGGSNKVITLCDGVPTVPSKHILMRFLVKRGFAVFHMRYRGTWESGGEFLKRSPHEDVLDLINEIPKGFTGLWGQEYCKIEPKKIYIFGSSFGGSAALLAASDPRVTKIVVFSPVVDWTEETEEEPFRRFLEEVFEGYKGAYRAADASWEKLEAGAFYNPVQHEGEIPPGKVLIIHARDDTSVAAGPVKAFAERIGCRLIMLRRGGHFGASKATEWLLWWRIRQFLSK